MKKYLYFLLLLPFAAAAQQAGIPRDTSFTVYSTYVKQKKNYPFISIVRPQLPAGVKASENVVYAVVNDRPLHADIFYPVTKKGHSYPAVVLLFGGGWRSGDKSQSVPMAQYLAAKGYVTMAVEYRLSLEAPYPAAVHDAKAAIRWLRAHAAIYGVDTAKIAIHGVSAGGQLAALVGTTNNSVAFEGAEGVRNRSGAVQAIVDIDGILAFKHPESEEGVMAAQWLGGTYEQQPQHWTEASALTHVDAHTPPTLFINSSLPRFHAGRDDMIKKLDSLGIYSQVYTVPDTPHPFWLFHPWFEPTMKVTVDFLDKVFKGRRVTSSSTNKD